MEVISRQENLSLIKNIPTDKLTKILNESLSFNDASRKIGIKANNIGQFTKILKERIKKDKIKYIFVKRFPQPNFKENYFKTINTKEKAYWLGFLAADGHITKYRVSVQLAIKDREQLERFVTAIGGETKYITVYTRKNPDKPNKSVCYYIYNKKFSQNLIDKGFESPKAKNVHFPIYKDKKLELAFLLGYFDGDGNQKDSGVTSCSEVFFNEIKERYSLRFKIKEEAKNTFKFYLGTQLLKKMLDNYKFSLPRKRRKCRVFTNKIKNPNHVKRKYNMTASPKATFLSTSDVKVIKKLLKTKPLTYIGKLYNYSSNGIKKFCKKHKIEIPKQRRWADIELLKKERKERCNQPEFKKRAKENSTKRAIRKYDYDELFRLYNEKKMTHNEISNKHKIKKSKFYFIIRLMKKRNAEHSVG